MIEYRSNTQADVMTRIGIRDFEDEDLANNFMALYGAIKEKRPEGVKGAFIKKVLIKTSRGSPVLVDHEHS